MGIHSQLTSLFFLLSTHSRFLLSTRLSLYIGYQQEKLKTLQRAKTRSDLGAATLAPPLFRFRITTKWSRHNRPCLVLGISEIRGYERGTTLSFWLRFNQQPEEEESRPPILLSLKTQLVSHKTPHSKVLNKKKGVLQSVKCVEDFVESVGALLLFLESVLTVRLLILLSIFHSNQIMFLIC